MTTTPTPTPDPDDAAALVAETEAFLAAKAPAPEPVPAESTPTKRVHRLRAEVAEAHALAELQEDETPYLLDTDRVRRRRKAAREAGRLHRLAQDPDMRAWQAARMRRVLLSAAMVSLALALGWSTAGVQAFAAESAPAWSARWLFAWCVEPFMSLALLTVVGAKAYMGTRGQPIESKTLTRIEWLFLALTFGMNAWPHLPGVADPFALSLLVLHVLGPVVAVAIVAALPVILDAFARLNHTAADLQWDRAGEAAGDPLPTTARGRSLEDHRAELNRLIKTGELPARPSAEKIRKALGCRREVAAQLRDELGA
jgi:hypothetical protein